MDVLSESAVVGLFVRGLYQTHLFVRGFKLGSYSYRTLLSIVPAACRS